VSSDFECTERVHIGDGRTIRSILCIVYLGPSVCSPLFVFLIVVALYLCVSVFAVFGADSS